MRLLIANDFWSQKINDKTGKPIGKMVTYDKTRLIYFNDKEQMIKKYNHFSLFGYFL